MKVNARISLEDSACYYGRVNDEKVLVYDKLLITEAEAREMLKHELLDAIACLSSDKIKVIIEKN